MADFLTALNITLQHEGGYADLVGDSGGETIFGISKNNHPKSSIWKELDNYKILLAPFDKSKYSKMNALCKNNRIIMNEVQNIYFSEYWLKIKGDSIKMQENANVLFDMAVNAGHSRAVKLAQEMLGIKADGICGNVTIGAINSYGSDFCNAYTNKRIEWYQARKNQTYIKAWVARAEKFRV